MGVGAGVYMYNVVVKSLRSLSHLLMSFLFFWQTVILCSPVSIMPTRSHLAVQRPTWRNSNAYKTPRPVLF